MAAAERARLESQYRAAKDIGDYGWASAIPLDAIEFDAAHPGEPRLMDTLRAVNDELQAVAP